MKARLMLAANWVGSNNSVIRTVVKFTVLAISMIAVGVAGAGPMPGGPDVP